jgi:flagellin
MALRINSNQGSANAVRNLNNAHGSLMKTLEKLSSGLRINRASDDPAGLVISEQLRSRIGSLNQEIENTSLAIRKYETADSTLTEMRSSLNELHSLAVGAANGGFNDDATQMAYDQAAATASTSFNNIIQSASFNNSNLFDGSEGSLANISQLQGIDLSTPEKAEESLKAIDAASARLDTAQNNIGSVQKHDLETKRSNLEVTMQNLTATESQIRDADFMQEAANMISDQIRVKSGMAILAQGNMNRKSVLSLLGK